MSVAKFFLGLVISIVGIINLVMVVFMFRDFSLQLLTMFFISLLVYPYGIYLMIRNKPSFKEESKEVDDKEDMKKMREMYESD